MTSSYSGGDNVARSGGDQSLSKAPSLEGFGSGNFIAPRAESLTEQRSVFSQNFDQLSVGAAPHLNNLQIIENGKDVTRGNSQGTELRSEGKPEKPGEVPPTKPGDGKPGDSKPSEVPPEKPIDTRPGEIPPAKPGDVKPGDLPPTKPGDVKPGDVPPAKPGDVKPGEPGARTEGDAVEAPEKPKRHKKGGGKSKGGHRKGKGGKRGGKGGGKGKSGGKGGGKGKRHAKGSPEKGKNKNESEEDVEEAEGDDGEVDAPAAPEIGG